VERGPTGRCCLWNHPSWLFTCSSAGVHRPATGGGYTVVGDAGDSVLGRVDGVAFSSGYPEGFRDSMNSTGASSAATCSPGLLTMPTDGCIVVGVDPLVFAAPGLAGHVLADLPARLQHTAAVADRAATLAAAVRPRERAVLLAAAWLHDIGYAPQLHSTGFHPLDGAQYLQRHGWPPLMCRPVAFGHRARRVHADLPGVADSDPTVHGAAPPRIRQVGAGFQARIVRA